MGFPQDVEAGDGGGVGTTTVTVPVPTDGAGDVGFLIAVPGEVRNTNYYSRLCFVHFCVFLYF